MSMQSVKDIQVKLCRQRKLHLLTTVVAGAIGFTFWPIPIAIFSYIAARAAQRNIDRRREEWGLPKRPPCPFFHSADDWYDDSEEK